MVTHDIEEAIALSDRVIILTNRPTKIKKEIKFDFGEETPTERRKSPKFSSYFNEIYETINQSK